jgi:fumarate hydratase, class I
MTVIHEQDFVRSIADALQYIAIYHPAPYLAHLARAHARERSPAARDAIAQILANSRMAALSGRPLCQDTGVVNVFLDIGMAVRWNTRHEIETLVNEGVRAAWTNPYNPLRASVVNDPLFTRRNTRDNTPAVVHMRLVAGDAVRCTIAAKGGGAENKSRFAVLNPSDSVKDWVLSSLPAMGAGWCPPGIIGLGVGGSAEKAMLMAKEALMVPIDMHELLARGPVDDEEAFRIELYEAINSLGIGAQGLGGLTTVLDVKLMTYPTHAASLPVALIPNCAADRHLTFTLDGSGPAVFAPPSPDHWPDVAWAPAADARRIDLDTLTREEMAGWHAGETLLLSGRLLTGRDAAHKRIVELLEAGQPLPDGVDFRNRALYYVGPVDPVRGEAVGPAGPTTATRMDKFMDRVLGATGLLLTIGKAERGPDATEAIRRHRTAYLIAVGGAAYLVSQAIRSARVVAFADLGMEAIYEFEVRDMPVTVGVDLHGESVHAMGPRHWQRMIRAERLSTRAA